MSLFYCLFLSIFLNSFVIIVINEILLVDGIVASTVGLYSTYNQLYTKQKKKTLITFSKTVSFLLFVSIPLIQIVLTLITYGVVVVSKVYWLYSIMLGYDFIEIFIRNKDLELKSLFSNKNPMIIQSNLVILKSNFRSFVHFSKQILRTKEFHINLLITIILSYLDISSLNVVHCITIFYIAELLVFYEKVLIAVELTFGSTFQLNEKRIGYLKKFNEFVWVLNVLMQTALLAKIIIKSEADVFTYLYIYSIPIIWYNS